MPLSEKIIISSSSVKILQHNIEKRWIWSEKEVFKKSKKVFIYSDCHIWGIFYWDINLGKLVALLNGYKFCLQNDRIWSMKLWARHEANDISYVCIWRLNVYSFVFVVGPNVKATVVWIDNTFLLYLTLLSQGPKLQTSDAAFHRSCNHNKMQYQMTKLSTVGDSSLLHSPMANIKYPVPPSILFWREFDASQVW